MNVFVYDFHPVRQCDRRAATKALCGEPAPMPYLVRVFRPHPSCAGKDGRPAHHCLIQPHLFIVWHLRLAISRANASSPFSRIYLIQAGRSDLKRNAKTFPIKFEYVLHPVTSMPHSAHERKPFCPTHLRILHHDAFSLVRHPGHLPARYFLHATQ